MLNTQNLTPKQLSALAALVISILVATGLYFLTLKWNYTLISLVIVFTFSYFVIQLAVETFINRKIKLIYKFIHQTKATRKEEVYFKYILPKKSIAEVREDVEKWGNRQMEEIEILRKNEAFRKEFLQNLSHEFKTPIFAIQGYVDTLLNGAMDDMKVKKRFLENTERNVERLVNLVNDLDEISKLESGEQLLLKQNFQIQDLIREVFESLSINMQDKNLRTGIKKGCEYPILVFADKEKIRMVLLNLVENASKYGKLNGSITASVYRTDGKHVLVEITDDGIGIEEEHLQRIFERFYRTDSARSRDKGGTGLGLAICKHIIEAHNQAIHVRSTPDVGTSIGFTLESKKD
jgi:two-component system, OmpR family, phosphate regulon sensor histidine kinase PhoR